MSREHVRVAGIDMGSNTTRLIVADVSCRADGSLYTSEVLERRSTITKLGEGVDARKMLLPVPITRVRNALTEYRGIARERGAVFALATATSAVRDADNGDAFLGEVEYSYGFRTHLLSGSEEAEATWSGVTSDPEIFRRTRSGTGMLIDIGGGSTEVLLTNNGIITHRCSFQLGSVRLTERIFTDLNERYPEHELAAARKLVRAQLHEHFPTPESIDTPIAVAGTATTVSSILIGKPTYDPDLVHGFRFTRHDLAEVISRLAALPLSAREQVVGLEPKRASVIVAGLLILDETLAHFSISEVETSERDILDGIVLLAGKIALDEAIEEIPHPFGSTIC